MRHGYIVLTTILMTSIWLQTQHSSSLPPISLTEAQRRHILQLSTQQITLPMALNHSDHTYHFFNLIKSKKELHYTALATIKFGYDLKDIQWVYDQKRNTVRVLRMPPKKVLDIFVEVRDVEVFKGGWLNQWSKEELTRVLGKDGITSIKAQIRNDPEIMQLAFEGDSNAISYIKDTLGLPFDGFQQQIDDQSIQSIDKMLPM